MKSQSVAKMLAIVGLTVGLFVISTHAWADDSSSDSTNSSPTNVSQADVSDQVNQQKQKNAQNANDVDKLITNNELRALSGAKSKWSMSNAVDYYGGTVASPLGAERPDITGGSGNTVNSYLEDQASVKYNLNNTNSLSAGIGLRWIAPTSPTGPVNYNGTTFDAVNPTLTYQNIANIHGVQSIFDAGFMQYTQADMTALGYGQNYSVSETAEYAFGKLTVGTVFYAQYNSFDKSGSLFDKNQNQMVSLLTQQSQTGVFVYPLLEYQLTDKLNFRTITGALQYEHYRNQANLNTYTEDTWYQSVGISYSVTRDIFLYPNVQFLPEHAAADLTNVALAAYINVF